MTNNLVLLLSLSTFKLMSEDNLLVIMMSMELMSMLAYFSVLGANPELSPTAYTTTMLTIMISESVLTLGIFVNLVRSVGLENLTSLSLMR